MSVWCERNSSRTSTSEQVACACLQYVCICEKTERIFSKYYLQENEDDAEAFINYKKRDELRCDVGLAEKLNRITRFYILINVPNQSF